VYSQPEFGQEATEEPMGEGLMDPEGQTYDETQQVRTPALTVAPRHTNHKSNLTIVFFMLV